MKKLFCILILSYYTIGSLLLPMGDFTWIPELSQMYRHCKAEEDKDMNLVDFVTDHLVNIDAIFDSHEGDDEQKPHQATNHRTSTSLQVLDLTTKQDIKAAQLILEPLAFTTGNSHYQYEFTGNVFRPPIG